MAPPAAAQPLVSTGTGSDPAFSVLTVPGGGTGRATLNAGSVISGNGTGNVLLSSSGTAGQVFVAQSSSTSGQYITPTAGTGLTVTTNATTLQYALASGGFTWTDVTGATQTLAAQNGYITDRSGGVTYTLPASGALGDTILVVGKLGITTIAQNASQSIVMSSATSTVGVSGSVAGTNAGDCITLVCVTAGSSTVWTANNWVGNWTVT